MRLLPTRRPAAPMTGPDERVPRRPLAVVAIDADADLDARLRTLARSTGAIELIASVETDPWGELPPLPIHTDVVVLELAGVRGLATLRELRRANHAWRTVVVAASTSHFDEAFGLGADAWIDRVADDRTIELAITGRRPGSAPA
jgi:ActR/RegA family two-component response regulator